MTSSHKIFPTVVALLFIQSGVAYADDCVGMTEQEHRIGSFHFQTKASVRPHPHEPMIKQRLSCVSNLTQNDLWVDWFIPGPRSWVLPLESVVSRRVLLGEKWKPIDGCIEFGNVGQITRAQFIGSEEDEIRADEEKQSGCKTRVSASISSDKVPLLAFNKLSWPVELYFPSNLEKPRDTMLRLIGSSGIVFVGHQAIEYFLEYRLAKAEGRLAGNPADIRVRLRSAEPMQELRRFFADVTPRPRPLEQSRYLITATVPAPTGIFDAKSTNFQIILGAYEFLDRNGKVVAATEFPVFILAGMKP